MARGLRGMLAHIRNKPNAETLVQRFLVLVAELKDGAEKVNLVLELAEILATSKPEEAISICHQVYQNTDAARGDSRNAEIRSLTIIKDCLVKLGRHGKAEVVGMELMKILRRGAVPLEQNRQDKEQVARIYQSEGQGRPEVQVGFNRQPALQDFKGFARVEPPPSKAREQGVAPGMSEDEGDEEVTAVLPDLGNTVLPGAAEVKKTILPEPPELVPEPPDVVPEPPDVVPEPPEYVPPLKLGAAANPSERSRSWPPNPTDFRLEAMNDPAPEPFFTEITDATGQAYDVIGDFASAVNILHFWQPLYDYLIPEKGGSFRHRIAHLRNRNQKDSWGLSAEELEVFIDLLDPRYDFNDELWRNQFTHRFWFDFDHTKRMKILRGAGLEGGAIKFWTFYLDLLLKKNRCRRALASIRECITSSVELSWGSEAYSRLPTIWSGLGFIGFEWHEEDGIEALSEHLSIRNHILVRSLLAG